MTKAAICITCADIVSPYRDWGNGRWRWCQCDEMGVRWRDGARGMLEVTALHGPDHLRVLGINNAFLALAVTANPGSPAGTRIGEQWRALHKFTCEQVEPHYLFHATNRDCWALVVRVGESSDVFFMGYMAARTLGPTSQQGQR